MLLGGEVTDVITCSKYTPKNDIDYFEASVQLMYYHFDERIVLQSQTSISDQLILVKMSIAIFWSMLISLY